jgi:glycosyltransferase involved in cell wall biosynthesis
LYSSSNYRKPIEQILFITSEPFPHGMAATTRILSLAKGFNSNGVEVTVICMNKTEDYYDVINTNAAGIYEGVSFRYLMNSSIASKHKYKRGIDRYLKVIHLIRYGLKCYNRNTIQIYNSKEMLAAIVIKIVSTIKGSLFIKEETEHPNVRSKAMTSILKYLFMNYHYKLFDGVIVISNKLIHYFCSQLGYKRPIFHLPMVVDVDRFSGTNKQNKKKAIVFCGVLDNKKEGIDVLLRAFKDIHNKHPEHTLNIYGKTIKEVEQNSYEEWFVDTTRNYDINKSAKLFGYKERAEITKIINNAAILVSPRPYSQQAEYGFSTKLGEYLISGNPVILTKVSGVKRHLSHMKNAYLCEPNAQSIADTMSVVISDLAKSKLIGENGRRYALQNFNNKIETNILIHKLIDEYSL